MDDSRSLVPYFVHNTLPKPELSRNHYPDAKEVPIGPSVLGVADFSQEASDNIRIEPLQ